MKVKWIHTFSHQPILIYSELTSKRYEARRVEYFVGGSYALASRNFEQGGTRLSSSRIPEIAEINRDSQFQVKEITEAEFNSIWDI